MQPHDNFTHILKGDLTGIYIYIYIYKWLPNASEIALKINWKNWHVIYTWWRHQMETFSTLLALCAGNSPVTGEIPSHRPVTRSFDVFFDLRLNKRLSKQLWGWSFETPSCPSWRHCNENKGYRSTDHAYNNQDVLWKINTEYLTLWVSVLWI